MNELKYLVTKHLFIWVLGFLPLCGNAQLEGCDMGIPPFVFNGIEVTDSFEENVMAFYNWPDTTYLCTTYDVFMWCDSCYAFGLDTVFGLNFAPFKYIINFTKPIKKIKFILVQGDYANFIFSSNLSDFELDSDYTCSAQIINDTILLGDTIGVGSGVFTITFDCPVYEFTISGHGDGGGTGFQICKNSLLSPYLWGRASGDTLVCAQDSVLLEAFGGVAPYTFSYNINNGATQTIQSNQPKVWLPTPSAAGTYTYKLLQVADGADSVAVIGCNHSHTVQVANSPIAQFSLSPQSGIAPFATQVSNSSSYATTYSWFQSGNPISINCLPGSSASVNMVDTGSYLFTLVAANALGCTDTAQATLMSFQGLEVAVPNVFTPNKDGVNDYFGITTSVDATATVVLLNRWGNLVLEKTFPTKSNTFLPIWDAATAQDGTYFYKIKISPIVAKSKEQVMSGFVEVVR